MAEQWANWSGDVSCAPALIATPGSEHDVVRIVESARRSGHKVRVAGTGHSSMPLAPIDGGVLVSLDRMQGVLGVDPENLTARIRAGSKLWSIGDPLLVAGVGMINMGDIDRQAIAGAMGTGTHGTGRTLRNISASVTGVRLVNGLGEIVELDESRNAPELRAARVSLGALGILTEVRLKVMPKYRLHERVWRIPIDECMAGLDSYIADNRHFEFFWLPKGDLAEMKTLNPTDAGPETVAGKEGERIGWSPHIIPSIRDVKFHEMEYAVPAEAGPACFQQVRERMRSRFPEVAWPVEYRTVAPDDACLSPHSGRDTVTISIHEDARRSYDWMFDIESIFREHGGRPHWGKINTQGRDELQSRYPDWDTFVDIRHRMDPDEVFLNPYLEGLFGV